MNEHQHEYECEGIEQDLRNQKKKMKQKHGKYNI